MGCLGQREEEGAKRRLMNTSYEKAIVTIENKSTKGLGFLCKLKEENSVNILPVLITTTDLIGKNELEVSKKIKFILENTTYELDINEERKTYINEDKYKIVIIEIKSEDNLNISKFFDFEQREKLDTGEFIGVIVNNIKEKFLEYFTCKISNINDNGYNMEYTCNNKINNNQLIGNPIINIENNKILGIQKNVGSGIILYNPIKEFMEGDKKKDELAKSIYQSLKKTFTLKSTIKIDQAKLDKEIGILYLLPDKPGITVLKIFGEEFVKNNKDKCKIILYDNEKDEEFEHDLCAFLDLNFIDSINSRRKLFKLFLVQTDYFYDLSFMFYQCFTLMSVDGLPGLYYDQVTNMKSMFHSCLLLQELDIANINTAEVKDMSFMFERCASLQFLDLSGWKTSNVKSMKGMFEACEKLEEIQGIGEWDLSNLKDVSFMFNFCKKLTDFPGIENWNTGAITTMDNIFKEMRSISAFPDLSKWDIKNVKALSGVFCNCSNLTKLPDISNWNTEKAETLFMMFYGCSKLKQLPDLSKWNISNVSNIAALFSGCESLESVPDISIWDTKNLENIVSVFCKCNSLISLPDLSKWNVSNVKEFNQFFRECTSLKTIPDISNWDLSNVIHMGALFLDCSIFARYI